MNTSPTNQDESKTWADALSQLLRDALTLAQAHPEVPDVLLRSIRRDLHGAMDLAKSDAPYLSFPDSVSPEAGIF